jgi:lactate dehydrogenase-like 2-hydroxyacid dehydrogenase
MTSLFPNLLIINNNKMALYSGMAITESKQNTNNQWKILLFKRIFCRICFKNFPFYFCGISFKNRIRDRNNKFHIFINSTSSDMKIVFLDTDTVGKLPELDELKKYGEVTCFPLSAYEETSQRINNAEIIITNKVIIDRKIMEANPALKLICVAATGMNNIDLACAEEKRILVKNVKGYSTDSVAQLTFGLMLNLLNHIPFYDSYVKSGDYSKGKSFTNLSREIIQIKGKTLGIIGLGAIGQKVAGIAKTFGAEVIYFSASGKNNNPSYKKVTLGELLASSDIVSIHAPLNDLTRNLIGAEQLKKMKPSAMLINTGRGGIVNEADLAKALEGNIIAGAAIDVYEQEPVPSSNPLLKIKNPDKILLTPHIAWSAIEARKELLRQIIGHICDL